MAAIDSQNDIQTTAATAVKHFQEGLGPFVVAADSTRMPIIFTDAQSRGNEIIYANESFLQLTGYELFEAVGLPFSRTLATAVDLAHFTPELISAASEHSLIARCRRKDGSEFDAALLATPVIDELEHLQQYFISFADLSPHFERHLEAHIRSTELYENTPGFIAFTEGKNHRITFANPAFEKLVGRSGFIGRTVADVLPELAEQGIIALLDSVYQTGQHFKGKRMPIRLQRRKTCELELRYIDFVYQPMRDADGETVGLFCEGFDVTDVQATAEKLGSVEAQLLHLSRLSAMGTMAATLAHELNQPLAAIANYASGCSNILVASGVQIGKLQEGLEAIAAASLRAGQIISKLRGMTRRTESMTEVFSLSEALRDAVALVRAGGCEGVSISTQCAPVALVRGDKIQVQQVIINLLRNACEAAAESKQIGSVVGITMIRNGLACLVIRDNGLGLSDKAQASLFQWTDSTKPDGMGMGLSISRTIAESHGGEIALDETSSRGASFSFCLPLASGD